MTRRTARFLTRLYPPRWRVRYGEEFQTFLESRRVPPIEVLTTIGSALSERRAGFLTTLLYACLAITAPGGAWYMTTSGAPLAQIIETHRAFWLVWASIQASSLAALAAGFVAVAPVLFRILRDGRPDVVKKLVWPSAAGLVLVLIVVPCAFLPGWLSPQARAAPALAVVGVFVDQVALFLTYVIAHSKLSRSLGRVKRSVLAMASWIMVASIMAATWGCYIHLFSNRDAVSWTGALLWLVAMTYRAVKLRLESSRIE
jgi:hypothetical protein